MKMQSQTIQRQTSLWKLSTLRGVTQMNKTSKLLLLAPMFIAFMTLILSGCSTEDLPPKGENVPKIVIRDVTEVMHSEAYAKDCPNDHFTNVAVITCQIYVMEAETPIAINTVQLLPVSGGEASLVAAFYPSFDTGRVAPGIAINWTLTIGGVEKPVRTFFTNNVVWILASHLNAHGEIYLTASADANQFPDVEDVEIRLLRHGESPRWVNPQRH